jgi:hypothetical protein
MSAEAAAPAPAEWKRVYRRGNASFTTIVAGKVPAVGWFEADAPTTNLDVIIDWSGATYPSDLFLTVNITGQGSPGSGLVLLASYTVSPLGGIVQEALFPGIDSWGLQSGPPSALPGPAQIFAIHTGGLAVLVWGVQIAAQGIALGQSVNNLAVSAIAHGREL